jgi:hypothetical protein
MERNYDDRQKSQQDRYRQPDQAQNSSDQQRRGGAQGSAADLEKRGRAGLPEIGNDADRQRSDRHKSDF